MEKKAYLILALLLVTGIPAGSQSESSSARIEWSDLPTAIVEKSPDLRTGYLIVPERRSLIQSRRMVRLPFIIMKSRSVSPQRDPILFTAGGPGGSTLARVRNRRRDPLLDDRDVILFEQRGTRYAEPALVFPEIDEALRSGWGTRLNGNPDPSAIKRAMATALQKLRKQGIDLAGYTTKESAADIADLRRLLEIPSWNLYGVSYSTKLMLTVLRDHPQGIRSAILDSVLPPDADWDEDAPANILEVLNHLFAVCRTDDHLRERCSDLKDRFFRFLAEANRRPIEMAIKNPLDGTSLTIRLDGVGIMNCIYAGLETAGGIRRLPLIIDASCRGDVQTLSPLLEQYLGSSQGNALGMRLAVWCNEEFPFERPSKILRPAGLPPELLGFLQTAVPTEAVKSWPSGRPDPVENEPVKSLVPVLIAAGEYDPDTPTKWAYGAAARLSNAQLLEFAGMSHVPLFTHPEAARIMKEFLADPFRRPDPGTIGTRPLFMLSLDTNK